MTDNTPILAEKAECKSPLPDQKSHENLPSTAERVDASGEYASEEELLYLLRNLPASKRRLAIREWRAAAAKLKPAEKEKNVLVSVSGGRDGDVAFYIIPVDRFRKSVSLKDAVALAYPGSEAYNQAVFICDVVPRENVAVTLVDFSNVVCMFDWNLGWILS